MAGKTATELRDALIVKALSKRSKVDLCTHGINKKFCSFCEAKKKRSKSSTAAAAAAAAAAESAETTQANPTV